MILRVGTTCDWCPARPVAAARVLHSHSACDEHWPDLLELIDVELRLLRHHLVTVGPDDR